MLVMLNASQEEVPLVKHYVSHADASQEDVPFVKHYVSHAKCKPRRGTLSETLC